MAHEFESGFFSRQGAWHGLGKVLQHPPTIEEGIKEAGLDWFVECLPVFMQGEAGYQEIPSHKAVIRSTDKQCLGIVKDRYRPLQNVDAFRFFQPFLQDHFCELEAAGSLRNGQIIWVLARMLNGTQDVAPNDAVESYLCLAHGHGGILPVSIYFTEIRVVCMNTLRMSLSNGNIVRIKHTKHLKESLNLVQQSVDCYRQEFSLSIESYRQMLRHKLPIKGLEAYVRHVFQVPTTVPEMPRSFEAIEAQYEAGQGASPGTLWGAFNAVTGYLDHDYGRSTETATYSNLFGSNADIRDRANHVALSVLKGEFLLE
jgi:phage/plasmid-like protein (TIGR03299 family)